MVTTQERIRKPCFWACCYREVLLESEECFELDLLTTERVADCSLADCPGFPITSKCASSSSLLLSLHGETILSLLFS